MKSVPLAELVELQIGYRPVSNQIQTGGIDFAIPVAALDSDREHIDEFGVPGPGRLWVASLEPIDAAAGKPEQRLQEGTVLLLSRGRRLTAVPICEGYVAPWPPPWGRAVVLYYYYILFPDTRKIGPRFLAWLINHGPLQPEIEKTAQGGILPYLKSQNLLELEVPLPPLDVQETLVEAYELMLVEQRLSERKTALMAQKNEVICSNILNHQLKRSK